MHRLRCLLTIIAFAFQTTGAAEIARQSSLDQMVSQTEQRRLMALSTEGVSERAALTRLMAYFSAPTDQAFLKAKWPNPKTDLIKVRSITPLGDAGYTVTMPNGRSFTAVVAPNLLVNKQAVSMASAEKFLTELNRALKTSFVVQSGWLGLAQPNQAEAATAIEYGLIAALIAVAAVTAAKTLASPSNANKAAPAPKTATVEDVVRQWGDTCFNENKTLAMPYQHSETLAIQKKMSPDLLKLIKMKPIDCVSFADTLATSGTSSKIGDYKHTCDMATQFMVCAAEYKTKSAQHFNTPPETGGESDASH